MGGLDDHNLLGCSLSALAERSSNDLKLFLSNAVLPSPMANRIFHECSKMCKATDWPTSFKDTNIKPLTELSVTLTKHAMNGLATYYMNMDMNHVRVLSLDIGNFVSGPEASYLAAIIVIRLLSTKVNSLRHLIITWDDFIYYKSTFKEIYRLLRHLIRSNPTVCSITIQERKVKEYPTYGMRHRLEELTYDVESVIYLVYSLPENLTHLAIIRHGDFFQGFRLFDSVCTRCVHLRSVCLHGALNIYSANEFEGDLSVLLHLVHLKELDISVDRESHSLANTSWSYELSSLVTSFLNDLMRATVPSISVLDLSGIVNLRRDVLRALIQTYSPLRCLRLCMTNYMFTTLGSIVAPTAVKILEYYTFNGALDCLKIYRHCYVFIKHTLLSLFNLKLPPSSPLLNSLLKEIQKILEDYKKNPDICLASTACLHNVINAMAEFSIPFVNMGRCIDLIIQVAKKYTDSHQIVRNCLVIICKETLVLHMKFNYYKCIKQCFRILKTHPADSDSPNLRMAVALISLMAAMIPLPLIQRLASSSNLLSLLDIIRRRIPIRNNDTLLFHALVCIWNLTDECPVACSRFITLNGITVYHSILELHPGLDSVQTKVFGLLNNIAEVPQLRPYIAQSDLVLILIKHIKVGKLPSSFFAAGVFANILLYWGHYPELMAQVSLMEARQVLLDGVNSFGLSNSQEIVVYRSFVPFIPLLNASDCHEVQWWAVWSIRHVTKLQREKYKPFIEHHRLVKEALYRLLHHPLPIIKQSVGDIFAFLE